MEFDVDVNELEQQRYDAIKKKGEYIELNVLIGTEKEEGSGRMPVVKTAMRGVGHSEIAGMYLTLKALVEQFKEKYPAECLYADVFMHSESLGTVDKDIKPDDEEE